MSDFTIAWPGVLLLLPLPWLARRYLTPRGSEEAGQLRMPIQANWIPNQVKQTKPSPKLDLFWLAVTYFLLIIALCRPQILGPAVPVTQAGRDIMLAIDTSKSMEETDFVIERRRVDRLAAVKAIASQFVEERDQDRIGLILFGSIPYLQAPLTFDHTSLNTLLQESFIAMAGPGTAIGDTIAMAVKTLKDQPAQSRVLILLTDGQNTHGDLSPEQAIEFAKEIDLKIYAIGIGQDPQETLNSNINNLFGNSTIDQLFASRLQRPTFDEATLKMIATETQGRFFRAKDTEELREIYDIIDEVEKREDESEFIRPSRDLYHWPLFASILMLLVYLSERHTAINWRPWRAEP